MMRTIRRLLALPLVALLSLSACAPAHMAPQVQRIRISERCPALLERATTDGITSLTEAEAREVFFCQQQRILQIQEETAVVARRQDRVVRLGALLYIVVVVVGAAVAAQTES